MNNTVKIPENLKKQVVDIINNSGITANEFINEISNVYNINESNNLNVVDYASYYDSFVE